MFAPKPFEVAKEMVRVTRPGGRIVMGNWIPNDPTLVAQILKISSNYTPPPPEGFVSPMTWGVESNVIERFTAAGIPKDNISFARDTFTFNFPGTPSELVDVFRKYYGPTMNAFEAAEKQGRAAELQKNWKSCSTAKTRVRKARRFLQLSYVWRCRLEKAPLIVAVRLFGFALLLLALLLLLWPLGFGRFPPPVCGCFPPVWGLCAAHLGWPDILIRLHGARDQHHLRVRPFCRVCFSLWFPCMISLLVHLIFGAELVRMFSSVTARPLKITFGYVARFVSSFSRSLCSSLALTLR